jgi:hypothetical protein
MERGYREQLDHGALSGRSSEVGPRAAPDGERALWEALSQHLGMERLGSLDAGGPDGPMALYLQHLVQVTRATGLDLSGYLPWNAPLSWSAWVAPYYGALWAAREEAEGRGAEARAPDTLADAGGGGLESSSRSRARAPTATPAATPAAAPVAFWCSGWRMPTEELPMMSG